MTCPKVDALYDGMEDLLKVPNSPFRSSKGTIEPATAKHLYVGLMIRSLFPEEWKSIYQFAFSASKHTNDVKISREIEALSAAKIPSMPEKYWAQHLSTLQLDPKLALVKPDAQSDYVFMKPNQVAAQYNAQPFGEFVENVQGMIGDHMVPFALPMFLEAVSTNPSIGSVCESNEFGDYANLDAPAVVPVSNLIRLSSDFFRTRRADVLPTIGLLMRNTEVKLNEPWLKYIRNTYNSVPVHYQDAPVEAVTESNESKLRSIRAKAKECRTLLSKVNSKLMPMGNQQAIENYLAQVDELQAYTLSKRSICSQHHAALDQHIDTLQAAQHTDETLNEELRSRYNGLLAEHSSLAKTADRMILLDRDLIGSLKPPIAGYISTFTTNQKFKEYIRTISQRIGDLRGCQNQPNDSN